MEQEKAFEAFLESVDYDRAEDALFSIVRRAFLAGWAAGRGKNEQAGTMPPSNDAHPR